jgi:hypothetical protein
MSGQLGVAHSGSLLRLEIRLFNSFGVYDGLSKHCGQERPNVRCRRSASTVSVSLSVEARKITMTVSIRRE